MTSRKIIDTLLEGKLSKASDALNDLMEAKAVEALEFKRVEVAKTIFESETIDEGVSDHKVGDRVQLHPGTDRWMMGDRYGTVSKVGSKHVHVHMDRSNKVIKVHPDNIGDNYGPIKEDITESILNEGGPTKKHFKQVADLLKHVEDPAKRKELAQHHASIFSTQNPRFDHRRFMHAAGVKLDEGRELSHDGFARTSVHKNSISTTKTCDNCGSKRPDGKLYSYSTHRDDSMRGGGNTHKGLFCSKSCHDSYHS